MISDFLPRLRPGKLQTRPDYGGIADCARISLAVVMLCMLSGCAGTSMKGTPFYTGEYKIRQGPVEDRVNFWPLLYYREPALSVLWPFFEFTEEHMAFRPLMSAYALDERDRVYNLLWPLAQYNQKTDNHRVFPVFWGDDHAAVFPLYWHRGNPFGRNGGTDAFIPIWSLSMNRNGYNAHLLWPFINIRDYSDTAGWRVWPFVGHYANKKASYSFALWPLMHQWSNTGNETSGSAVIPLYYHHRSPERTTFLSLPYSSMRTAEGSRWQLVPPVFCRRADADSSFTFTPVYLCGSSDAGKTRWNLLLPVSYKSATPDSRLYATLLGGFCRKDDLFSWMAGPGIAFGNSSPNGYNLWFAGPLAHLGRDNDQYSAHLLPFFYTSADKSSSTFLSLPWSHARKSDGSSWSVVPPLYLQVANKHSNLLLTPLYAQGSSDDGSKHWNASMPLYYYEGARRFFTPIIGWNKDKEDGFFYPLTPLAALRTGDYNGGWLFPVFSHKGEKASGHYRGTFLWGQYWKQGSYSGSRIFPVYGYKNTRIPDTDSSQKPGRYADYGREFVGLPACWYRNMLRIRPDWQAQQKGDSQAVVKTKVSQHGFFPFWSYSRAEAFSGTTLDVSGRILLALYDYKREVGPVSATDPTSNDYARSRVLWRLWHYEKLNNDVSVDIFPGITYDRRQHDFKKFAFLRRFFRYQRDAVGKKVDVLFIPVLRTKARR